MKCPICDKEIVDHSTDYMDDSILMEENAKCADEQHTYRYDYAHGSSQESINSVTFFHHHAFSKKSRDFNSKVYDFVVDLARAQYQENQ